jgi:twitching motility protein PilT
MAAAQPRIEVLLDEVIKKKASDLHLQVGLPPMLRVDGALTPVTGADPLNEEAVEVLVFSILDEDQKQILLKDKEFDFSFAYGDLGRFRVNAFHERGNLAAAMRLIPNEILSIEQLGLPQIVNKFTEFPRGLVLVTGPTGSGKSTSLSAMIHKINQERASHIITIEDPIEFTHKSQKSVIVQREVHYDTYSFSAALRSALREDPDVVLIGEMRDLETIASAITIAETGHLVLATLHTNSASQSIDRMIDVFPPHQQPQIRAQLSNILMAIVSQRLIPSIGGGRIAAAEILVATPAVRNIIREGKSHQLEAVIQTGTEFGMQSMDKQLVSLIHAGTITYDEARNYAVDIDELDRLMRS